MKQSVRDFIDPIRKTLLTETDYTQLEDAPLTPEEQAAWAAYRQELRDMPENQNPNTEYEVIWPVKP